MRETRRTRGYDARTQTVIHKESCKASQCVIFTQRRGEICWGTRDGEMGCNLCTLQKREEHYKLLYEIAQ
ncbi:hypothetical protein QQF64_035353, partial [Cirrhinus molitorella]